MEVGNFIDFNRPGHSEYNNGDYCARMIVLGDGKTTSSDELKIQASKMQFTNLDGKTPYVQYGYS